MSARKTEFWWASIHGAEPEPVERTTHDGRDCVYTLGCDDPFYLDEKPCPVLFVNEMHRPRHPDQEIAESAASAAGRKTYVFGGKRLQVPAHHGWRGPR